MMRDNAFEILWRETSRPAQQAELVSGIRIKLFFAWLLLSLTLQGCATPRVNPMPPLKYRISVQADGTWQSSGVFAEKGQLIECAADGQWGDADKLFGPKGDSSTHKDHHGVNAPAYALLMRLSTETNTAHYVGSEANITAKRSGTVLFRANTSLSHRSLGQMIVLMSVASDADSDGVSDYDEIKWGTNPLDPDTDGLGFGDYHKVKILKKEASPNKDDR